MTEITAPMGLKRKTWFSKIGILDGLIFEIILELANSCNFSKQFP